MDKNFYAWLVCVAMVISILLNIHFIKQKIEDLSKQIKTECQNEKRLTTIATTRR